MSITYEWKILQLERNANDDGVVIAHWECTGVDTETANTSRVYGSASFSPDPTNESFIAFEDLTEELVISWVQETVVNDNVEQTIAKDIEDKNNPPVLVGVPWQTHKL